MEKRRSDESANEIEELTPSEDSVDGWFKLACQLASKSQLIEAERAMKIALEMKRVFPKAWAILSAVYLSLGKETDAEKAGKIALSQCVELKMTWPKLRNIILSNGIKKGSDWKSPRRVLLDEDAISAWGDALVVLEKTILQEIEKPSQSDKTEPVEKKEDEKTTIMVERVIEETHAEREVLPSISSRKVEGLTTFVTTKLQPELEDNDQKFEEVQPELKRQALPTFSSKKVVDVTQKYDESSPARETKVKEVHMASRTPESASTWFRIAEAHMKKGESEEAEKAFMKGLAQEPENSEAWINVGSLLMKRSNYKDAEDALRVAVKHSQKNANAWYLLGVCLQQLGSWIEALKALQIASNIDQTRADIWLKLGESEFHAGQYQDAARSFLRTLRISPDSRDAMFYLAMCMERRGNRQHALSLYIKLLNMGELPSDMLERIAGSLERLNRPIEAREARRKAALMRKVVS